MAYRQSDSITIWPEIFALTLKLNDTIDECYNNKTLKKTTI